MKKKRTRQNLYRGGMPKFLLKMKLLSFFILVSTITTIASNSYSQQTLFNMSLRDATVRDVLQKIEDTSEFIFLYSEKSVDVNRKVDVDVTDKTVEEVLDQLFNGTRNHYEIKNRQIAILEKRSDDVVSDTEEIVNEGQQLKSVSGLVTDSSGAPLPGVALVIKGQTKGTITDAEGKYTINVPDNATLVFSFVGMKTTEVIINGKNTINVSMLEESVGIDEVIAIGYGTMKKKDITGSVASIKSEELIAGNPIDVLGGIQGKLAGVMISSASGDPSAGVDITIRGYNSLAAGTTPLFVIDGVPYDINTSEMANSSVGENNSSNPLSLINPSDIETVTVLKDASATSIYGSRGANGVIIIETKSGQKGQALINLNTSFGVAETTRKIPVLSGNEFIEYRRDVDPSGYLFFYNANPETPRDPYTLKQHNWQNEILREGIQQNYDLSVSGKTDQTTYSGSLGYLNNEGIVKNNDYQRYSSRLKIDHQKSRRLLLGLNTNTTYSIYNGATQSGGGSDLNNGIVQNLVISTPVELYNPTFDPGDDYISPSSMVDEAYKQSATLSSNTSAYMHYKLAKDLTLMASGSGSIMHSKCSEFYGKNTYWGAADKGYGSLSESKAYSLNGSLQLHYNKKVGEDHDLKMMIATETNTYNYEWFNIVKTNFLDESTGIFDISKGSTTKSSGSYRDNNKRVSFFGRINYSFKEKHLLTVNFRADGSDKFGSGNRFGYFPSVAYSWMLINESFMKDQTLLSNAKLRLSSGLSGNDRIPSHRYLARLENSYYDGTLGMSPSSQANADLKWETTFQNNVGIDLGFFKNAITLSIDLYKKETKDMLIEIPTAGQTGYSSRWENVGKINNQGIEFQLSSVNINNKKFKWNTSFNFSSNKNIVKDLNLVDYMTVSMSGAWIQDIGRVAVGRSLGEAYGYVFDGVYQISDFTWQNNSDESISYDDREYQLKSDVVSVSGVNVKPGSHKFKDLNNDGEITLDKDRKSISSSQPKFFGGITNNFQFKNFDLNILFEGAYGNEVFNESKYRLEGGAAHSYMNVTKEFYYRHWTPENASNSYGDYADRNVTSLLASSYYVEDASYIRLKSVTFGYSLPKSVLKELNISETRFYLSGSNLYTWTKYSGFDPEVNSGNILMSGVDRISYPRSRTIIFGINVTF